MPGELQRDSELIGYRQMGRLVVKEDARAISFNVRSGKNPTEFPSIPGHAIVDPHDLKAVNRNPLILQYSDPHPPESLCDLRAVGKLIVVTCNKE